MTLFLDGAYNNFSPEIGEGDYVADRFSNYIPVIASGQHGAEHLIARLTTTNMRRI